MPGWAALLSAGHRVETGGAQPLSLRIAASADAGSVAAFHCRLWHSTYANIAPPEAANALDLAHRRAYWDRRLPDQAPPSAVLLAESSGRLAGICAVSPSGLDTFPGALEVDHLYVDPDCRRGGAGRMLLNWALEHAAQSGARDVVLAAVRQNASAIAFYRACGGAIAGERRDKGPLWRSENVIFRWQLKRPA